MTCDMYQIAREREAPSLPICSAFIFALTPAAVVGMTSLNDKRLALLDDVIQRFTDKQEHLEMRAKVAGTHTPRELPVQKLGKIKEVSDRGPRRLELLDLGPGASTSLPGGSSRDAAPLGRPKPKRPPKALDLGPGAFTGGQGRTARIRDGKAILAATMTSTQPIFRELKPIELARPAGSVLARKHADADEADVGRDEGGAHERGSSSGDFTMDLMMTMDSDNLGWLKRQFAKFRDELDIYQFVAVMRKHIDKASLSPSERVALVANLKELFDQVDVNGDERMEWAELTSFIVDAQTTGGALKETPLPLFKQIDPVQDETRLRSEQSIERVYYLPGLDLLLMCERPAALVSVYSPKASPCLHELSGHRSEVLAIEHVPECGVVVTSGADLALCFWDAATPTSPSWRLRQKAALQHSQTSLCWCAVRGQLFSGGADGTLHAWDVVKLEVAHRMHGHEDAVTTLIMMKQRKQLLASASLDKCIRLWDVNTLIPKCIYTLGPPNVGWAPHGRHTPSTLESDVLRCHERGITCLAFTPQHRHLFSGGLDHELLVWNPLSERVICNLRQHSSPLVAVDAVERTPMVVSADLSGLLCAWDCRSLTCSQKLQVQMAPGVELGSMALLPKHHQIITTARRLATFQGPKEPDDLLTDSEPIVCGLYNTVAQSFCTASGTSVMIWDATSGQLARQYTDVTPTPITSMCFDDRQRKLLVADHEGHIIVLNYTSGAVMKSMHRHSAEVSALLYIPGYRYLMCTSWDRTVSIQDESEPDVGRLIKALPSGHACDVTTAAYSATHALLATGGDDGGLQIWRLDERSIPHPHYELRGHRGCITALCFLEPWPLLASADSTGVVRVWTTRFEQPQMRFRQLLQMTNQAAKGLWLAPWLRAATVQFNNRNTDGTLSEEASLVATSKKLSGGSRANSIHGGAKAGGAGGGGGAAFGTSRSLVGASLNSIRVGKTAAVASGGSGGGSGAAGAAAGAAGAAGGHSPPRDNAPSPGGDSSSCFLTQTTAINAAASPSAAPAASTGEPDDAEGAWPPDACAVTSLCFAPERKSLAWGDDAGRIVIWDLRALLDAMPPPPPLPAAAGEGADAPSPDELGRRSRRASRASGEEVEGGGKFAQRLSPGRLADHAKESAWLLAKLQGKTVRIMHVWQAHSDAVTSLCSIRRPPSLFSTSADRMAFVWKHDGSECYGSLSRAGGAKRRPGSSSGGGGSGGGDKRRQQRRRRRRRRPARADVYRRRGGGPRRSRTAGGCGRRGRGRRQAASPATSEQHPEPGTRADRHGRQPAKCLAAEAGAATRRSAAARGQQGASGGAGAGGH